MALLELRGEVVSVGQLRGDRHGLWSCTRCGRAHPAEESRAVRLRGAAGNEWTVVMCPGCATELAFNT